jgi:AraC family transcriptional regulator
MVEQHEGIEVTLAAVQRLRSAVVELSSALNETLQDDRTNAAAALRRAKGFLLNADYNTNEATEPGPRRGLAPWQIAKVLTHIETNLGRILRNTDLAAVVRLSVFHFTVAFRNSVGEPPHAYIMRRRVERAQGLMLSTDRSLSDIALECGMADQAHLSRLFRNIVGDSPARWRRARASPH